MALQDTIYKLRTNAHMSREKLAEELNVSAQAVQKWETGATAPDIKNLVKLAKFFHVSIDALLLDSDVRIAEVMNTNKEITPNYVTMDDGVSYAAKLEIEFTQSMDEGLDIAQYKDLFNAVAKMPAGVNQDKMADVLFNIVLNAPLREDFLYVEPSALEKIKALRKPYPIAGSVPTGTELRDKIYGAWMGRVCGCLLGKPIECIRTNELHLLLQESGNWPMYRYILSSDVTQKMCDEFTFNLRDKCYADTVDCMPVDDDTNYTVLAQELVEKYSRDFTARDVSQMWLSKQSKDAYFTAERVAFRNFVNGYAPPESAAYKNPFREYIGAQIRGDYFGYINPGDPEMAAEMAFRDASISHVKNGIYGEMFISAMLACAAVTDNIEDIIRGGLAQIPHTSRLYEAVNQTILDYHSGVPQQDCFRKIHVAYDEYTGYGWCHTISNAMIVTAALLYGGGDYGKSICMAVETGFDTDCNGATVGSILGMRNGIDGIGEEWRKPVNDTVDTSIFGVGKVKISDRVEQTLRHLKQE